MHCEELGRGAHLLGCTGLAVGWMNNPGCARVRQHSGGHCAGPGQLRRHAQLPFALQGGHLVRAPGPAASGVAAGQATSLCEDPEGFVCTTRTRASAAKYLDIDYPDIFVFLADA